MGPKAILAALCCLALSGISAHVLKINSGVIDNIGAESAPRLYRNVPVGVYASAVPYASYSFNVPTLVSPKSTQIVPVKEENIVVQNTNGFLKDSYGQRFVESPQNVAYKTTFPQQFVELQNLPSHLAQPIVAAAPTYQYGQTPHFFGQNNFGISNIHSLAPSHITHFNAQPFIYASNLRSLAPSSAFTAHTSGNTNTQKQPSSNKNSYVNSFIGDQQSNKQNNEQQFQRIQGQSNLSAVQSNGNKQVAQANKLQLVQVPKETQITSVTNGKKTVVNLITKPPLPLLDLTLLEPLTFKNPLVPQLQHFLPRIHQVTYKKLPEINEVKKHQMEFVVQNTKTYNTDSLNNKPQSIPKNKNKKQPPPNQEEEEEEEEVVPPNDSHHTREISNESPEISYEINSPNYKETYTEHKMSYNKETQSEPVNINYEKQSDEEPVHYSYEERTEKKPIHYTYSHNSKEPVKHQQVYYENNEDTPKQLIYHFKPDVQNKENHEPHAHATPQTESQESSEGTSEESNEERHKPQQEHKNENREHNHDLTKTTQLRPEHREQGYYHFSNNDNQAQRHDLPQLRKPAVQYIEKQKQYVIQPTPEYEEDITFIPTHKPHAELSHHQNYNIHINHKAPPPKKNIQHHYEQPQHYSSAPVEQQKSKRLIIKEGTTAEVNKPNDELMADMVKKQEESEEDFEKAYKDAAYGFAAYDSPSIDIEKEVYNPEAYGDARYRQEYDIEKSPLRQYEAEGDEFPTLTRAHYKDVRDKGSDNYYLDYAVSRPESLRERNKKKEIYFDMYNNNQPEFYFGNENKDKKNQKYSAAPTFGYFERPQQKQQYSKYRVAQPSEDYNFNKQAPRDSSAYASRAHQRLKSKTHFVEPQFQYGFEPSSLPRLLDSELAAMASNSSPKSEKPGTRKKNYKENWYVKKSNKSGKSGS